MTLRKWQQTVKDPKLFIVQASSQDGFDGWTPFPIGMSYQYVENFHEGKKWHSGSHRNLVHCAIGAKTDETRRPLGLNRNKILHNLLLNNVSNTHMSAQQYFSDLPSYKFVVSPEGNGIDCHRHYEALMAGCIPIVENNSLIIEKYKGCPILFTEDYAEINRSYLEHRYKEMLDQVFDFSKLFLEFYSYNLQKQIKSNGNYWVNKLCKKTWYS